MLIRETHRIQTRPGAYGLLAGLLVLLFGLVANASCVHVQYEPNYIGFYDAAVEITAHCTGPRGEALWYGSGVVVDGTRLLTAAHVAEKEDPEDVCSFIAEDSRGNIFLIAPLVTLESDLASMVLISPTKRFEAPAVRFGPVPKIGETVCTATAHPRREARCAMVTRPKAEPPGDIRIDMVVEPGNSGSGLYNMRGELVGIVVHTYPNRGNGQFVSAGATSLQTHLKELLP